MLTYQKDLKNESLHIKSSKTMLMKTLVWYRGSPSSSNSTSTNFRAMGPDKMRGEGVKKCLFLSTLRV